MGTVAVVVGAVIALTWAFRDQEPVGQGSAQPAFCTEPTVVGEDAGSAVDAAEGLEVPPLTPGVEFSPEELIDNPNCNFIAGLGDAAGVAVYVLSEGPGARFAVLDRAGTVFGNELPFDPNHYRLGKREDGSVVVALADLRLNSKEFRPENSPEPIRVYRDGQLIFEHDKVWQFGVASDGSSFYAIEPLAGEASRLIVRNLDDGREHHHDLGPEFNPFDGYEIPYVSFYSTDSGEVMFWLYRTANGGVRERFSRLEAHHRGPRPARSTCLSSTARRTRAVSGGATAAAVPPTRQPGPRQYPRAPRRYPPGPFR
ncbi:MAG: hypothetical protein OXH09_11245 [Gammaproteobacteria bacterium]|nr:hypothetical protein [Gammaproteobacteria bacterium]